mmetsp:Transcript_51940/g.134304  ORF Transcript_51940/g.134304 Transcript_51940/m.134304 type:complete len:893 (+) Transcript_51940:49-2727(+)
MAMRAVEPMTITFGARPPALHRSMNCSRSSLLEDSFSAPRLASTLRNPQHGVNQSMSLVSSASFLGSGISDLRAAVCAQQKNLDSMVVKVAALLSAMHQEMLQDIRGACERDLTQVAAHIEEEVARASGVLEGRFADGQSKQLGWLQSEADRLREGLSSDARTFYEGFSGDWKGESERVLGEVRELSEGVSGEMRDMQDSLWAEVHNLHAGLADEVQHLQKRLARVEGSAHLATEAAPSWDRSMEQCCGMLRDEFYGKMLDESEPMLHRLMVLEESVISRRDKSTSADASVVKKQEKQGGRIEKLEVGLRNSGMMMQRLEEELRGLRQVGATSIDMEAQTSDWRQRVEERLEAVAPLDARLGHLEEWRKRADPRLERLPGKVDTLRESIAELREHFDANLPSVQRECKRLTQRIDELGSRADMSTMSTSAVGFGESRIMGQRLQELDMMGSRVDVAERAIQAMQRQLLEELQGDRRTNARAGSSRADLASRVETGLTQMQSHIRQLSDELWQSLSAQTAKEQTTSHRLADELRQDLKGRLSDAQEASKRATDELRKELESRHAQLHRAIEDLRKEMEKVDTKSSIASTASQRLSDELRKDVELRVERAGAAVKKVADDLGQARHDLEAKVAQLQSSAQQLPNQLHQEVEGLISKRAISMTQLVRHDTDARLEKRLSQMQTASQRTTKELREAFATMKAGCDSAKALAEEQKRHVGDLRATVVELRLASVGGIDAAAEAAQDMAADGVAALGRRLEDSLRDRLSRCDAAAAGCERCARAVEERLRFITDDLQRQLAQDEVHLIQLATQEPAPVGSPSSDIVVGSPPVRRGVTFFGGGSAGSETRAASAADGLLPFQPQSPSGLLAALSGTVAQQETTLESLRRENLALRGRAG